MLSYATSTPIFNRPVLHYTGVGVYPAVDIPVVLTTYKVASSVAKTLNIIGIPWISQTANNAIGGNTLGWAAPELPKLQLEGFYETPSDNVNGNILPALMRGPVTTRLSFGDFITMNLEGRGNILNELQAPAIHPEWFRDPYGRVYTDPRVFDFQATYVPGRPQRQNFTMTLQVTKGYDV